MNRTVLMQIAVAVAVVLVTATATVTAMAVVNGNGGTNGLIASLNDKGLLGLINGRNASSGESGGAGLTITVLPAPEPEGSAGEEEPRVLIGAIATTADDDASEQAEGDTSSSDSALAVAVVETTNHVQGSNPAPESETVVSNVLALQGRASSPVYALTMQEPTGRGTVAPTPGAYTHPAGTVVDIEATPDAGWSFTRWTGNVADATSAATTVTMDDDKTVRAHFSRRPVPLPPVPAEYTLTIEQKGEGTLDPEPGEHTYEEGTEVTIKARPDAPWYVFGYWMVDDEILDFDPPPVSLTVTVDFDMTVTAVFVEPPAPPPGEFEIWIPPLAGPETLEIEVTTREAEPEICQPRGPVDGLVFEVTAYLFSDDEESVELSKFDEPVTVTLHWDEQLDTEDAERILVHYYHEALEMWIPLPTQVDVDNQTVTTQIDRPADLVMCIKDKFTDIDGHWGEKYILFLSEVGPIDGYLDMTFRPDDLVTREQFAKMLVESAGLSPQFARRIDFLFNDAGEISDWARPYAETAVLDRLVLGFENDTFRPHAAVTRAQVATMISRALGLAPVGEPPFADANEIPDWAAGHVAALSHLDIVMGLPGNLFVPHRETTRAEVAAFLTRYLEERLRR